MLKVRILPINDDIWFLLTMITFTGKQNQTNDADPPTAVSSSDQSTRTTQHTHYTDNIAELCRELARAELTCGAATAPLSVTTVISTNRGGMVTPLRCLAPAEPVPLRTILSPTRDRADPAVTAIPRVAADLELLVEERGKRGQEQLGQTQSQSVVRDQAASVSRPTVAEKLTVTG